MIESALQKQRLTVMAQARALCEQAGCVTKVDRIGVLIIVLPEYGEPQAEQLFLEASEPKAGISGQEGR
jgi:hypothetical protein